MLMLGLQALVESVLGRPVREARFEFAYPAPTYADLYREHFHGDVRFDRPETRSTLRAAWLARPCPMADPAMYSSAVSKLEAQARRLEGEDFLLARLEQALDAAGDARLPLAGAARHLRLSRRTLNRRLAEWGTSYRQLLEGHLRERACRRWYGTPPGKFRKTLRRHPPEAGSA
jgi:hypothetical protein